MATTPHEQSPITELVQKNKRQQSERDEQRAKHERERLDLRRRHNQEDEKDRRHRAYPEARAAVRAGEQAALRLKQRKEYESLRDKHRLELGRVQ